MRQSGFFFPPVFFFFFLNKKHSRLLPCEMEEAQPPKIISPYLIHWSQNEAWSRRRQQQQQQQLRTPHVKVRVRAQHRCQTWRQGSSTQSEHAARTSRCLMSVAAWRLAALFCQIYLSLCLRGIRSGDGECGGETSSAAGVQGWHYFSPPTLHPPPRKRAFLKDNWRVCCRRRRVMEICLMRSCGAWRMRERRDRERRESVRKRRTWLRDMNFFLNKDRGKINLNFVLLVTKKSAFFCLCEIFKNVPSRVLI